MQRAKHADEDVFTDVIVKIRLLTASQQRFIQEMLFRQEETPLLSKTKLLKKSFGAWAGRKDIRNSIEYVDKIREGWGARLAR